MYRSTGPLKEAMVKIRTVKGSPTSFLRWRYQEESFSQNTTSGTISVSTKDDHYVVEHAGKVQGTYPDPEQAIRHANAYATLQGR